MSQTNKERDLLKKVELLLRENKALRKKLGKFRKVANNGIHCAQPEKEETHEKHEEVRECDYCRGEIKRIKIHNLAFDVCQKCKNRTKIE